MGGGKAAAQWILTQPAKSERRQLPLLLPTLLLLPLPLLLKPLLLLLLTSQMATLGLGPGVSGLGPGVSGLAPQTTSGCPIWGPFEFLLDFWTFSTKK